jgi:uncharacterized protein (DUF1697 family)
MPKFVAFLRGINVGGHNVIKMADLRAAFVSLGYANVETFIQSGNVVFESSIKKNAAFEQTIETQLQQSFDAQIPVVVRTADEVASVAKRNPFPDKPLGDAYNLYVAFAKQKLSSAQQAALQTAQNDFLNFHTGGADIYCLVKKTAKPFNLNVEKIIGAPVTMRNWQTLGKLVAKHL